LTGPDVRVNKPDKTALKMITLFTELSGFGTDHRISIKFAYFIVILRSIVFFAECLEPSYSTLVIKNGGIIISGIFQGIDK
jgi:hypothetical protein